MHSLPECCCLVTFEQVFRCDRLNGGDVGGYSFLSDRRRDLLIEIFLPGFHICDVTNIFLIEIVFKFLI